MRAVHFVINRGLDIFWYLRPFRARVPKQREIPTPSELPAEETRALRSLITRFPYWIEGRYQLAEASLAENDIATAYCEGQALQSLSPHKARDKGRALFVLGRCYLRRGDSGTALVMLNEAAQLLPLNYTLREEISAALVLEGDKTKALSILKGIPEGDMTAEGKAALRWLSSTNDPSVQ